MVLFSHAILSIPGFVADNFLPEIYCIGHTGVLIFFVVSGYLITNLFIQEKEVNGSINIKDFYVRRFLRLFPAFYLYIAVVILLKNTFYPDIFSSYFTIVLGALYLWDYRNLLTNTSYYDPSGNWYMTHLWSLSIEEQFYLIWPFIFKKNNLKQLKRILLISIILIPIIRVLTYAFFPGSRVYTTSMFHTSIDTILIGCLGALLEKSEKFIGILMALWNKTWLLIIAFIYLFIANVYLQAKFRGAYILPIGISLTSFIILFFILWSIHMPSPFQLFLNKKWLMQIGMISYSLYIWQQLFLAGKIIHDKHHFFINLFPYNLIFVFAVGFTSFYLIENPISKLKARFRK